MSAKNKALTKETAKEEHFHKEKRLQFTLKIGAWKSLVPDEERKMILARSLNYCVHHHQIKIKGYLITESSVYLVVDTEKKDVQGFISSFEKEVSLEVKSFLKYFNNARQACTNKHLEKEPLHHMLNNLFTCYKLLNEHLVLLLTGKKIELNYSSAGLEHLKAKVEVANFCSVIDYSGAIGPVIVSKT